MAKKSDRDDLHNICRGIFTVSRFCGIFPFSVTRERLKTNVISLMPLLLLEVWGVYHFLSLVKSILFSALSTRHALSLAVLAVYYLILFILPLISGLWLVFKSQKLIKALGALLRLQKVTSQYSDQDNQIIHVCLVLVLVGLSIYGRFYLYSAEVFSRTLCFAIFHYLSSFILFQFTYLVKVIQGLFEFVVMTLDTRNAEQWCKCHEILNSCCNIVSESYGPQILLLFFQNFIAFVSLVYYMIFDFQNYDYWGVLVNIISVILVSYLMWYALFCCRGATLQAKRFDTLLYHLVINDDSNILVRNKRIRIHFKGKRKVEFSALGFFNLDYPLICSMICSATTYIVVLIQFSN